MAKKTELEKKVRGLQRRLRVAKREVNAALNIAEKAADAVDDSIKRIEKLRNDNDWYFKCMQTAKDQANAMELQSRELLYRVERREAMIGRMVMQMADRHSTLELHTSEIPLSRFLGEVNRETCDKPDDDDDDGTVARPEIVNCRCDADDK